MSDSPAAPNSAHDPSLLPPDVAAARSRGESASQRRLEAEAADNRERKLWKECRDAVRSVEQLICAFHEARNPYNLGAAPLPNFAQYQKPLTTVLSRAGDSLRAIP